MTVDLKALLAERGDEVYDLHAAHLNPQFVKVLRTIKFDRGFTEGRGAYLFDAEGNRTLDMLAGYGVFNIGRGRAEVRDAIKQAMDLNLPNLVQMDCARLSGLLAERLLAYAPDSIDKAFFTNSGTEAVEGAIKFARAATKKPTILYWDHAFHGLSNGSLSANGSPEFREGFGPLLPFRELPFNDLDALERELKKGDVAALIVEPIQGKGVYVPDDDFFTKAQALLHKHKALLIVDEVQTGLGRTGSFFAFEHWKVKPDIVTVAKALSGGMIPVGAVLMTTAIYAKTFSRMDRCVVHSSTFAQNDLAMAAGLATLEVYEREGITAHAGRIGALLMERLEALKAKHGLIVALRGKGLMIGIEFGPPDGLLAKMKWKLVGTLEKGLFTQAIVMHLMDKHRILTQVAGHQVDIIKLIPPLTITEQDVDTFVKALDATLEDCSVSGSMLEMSKNLGKHALLGR